MVRTQASRPRHVASVSPFPPSVRVIEVAAQIDPGEVADAFLGSLTTRRLDLRSALGSYAAARHLREHDFELRRGHGTCETCGAYPKYRDRDRNVLNFERFKWGGVRHDDLTYQWHDLDVFRRADRLQPTDADRRLLDELFDSLDSAPPTTTASTAHKHLRALPGNKGERDIVIDILGLCSILETHEHTGYAERFVPATERQDPPRRRFVERTYPASWWRGGDGVNRDAARQFRLL